MFIDKLNDCEKQILMDLYMHIAVCDNNFSPKEVNYITAIREKYKLIINFHPQLKVYELCGDIKRDQSKVIILQELLRAAIIDDDFASCEKKIINEVVKHFRIGNAKYLEIEEWVEKGIEWYAAGNAMIASLDARLNNI